MKDLTENYVSEQASNFFLEYTGYWQYQKMQKMQIQTKLCSLGIVYMQNNIYFWVKANIFRLYDGQGN